jgi:hypothetical protein
MDYYFRSLDAPSWIVANYYYEIVRRLTVSEVQLISQVEKVLVANHYDQTYQSWNPQR